MGVSRLFLLTLFSELSSLSWKKKLLKSTCFFPCLFCRLNKVKVNTYQRESKMHKYKMSYSPLCQRQQREWKQRMENLCEKTFPHRSFINLQGKRGDRKKEAIKETHKITKDWWMKLKRRKKVTKKKWRKISFTGRLRCAAFPWCVRCAINYKRHRNEPWTLSRFCPFFKRWTVFNCVCCFISTTILHLGAIGYDLLSPFVFRCTKKGFSAWISGATEKTQAMDAHQTKGPKLQEVIKTN